jgi:hypothetical protein
MGTPPKPIPPKPPQFQSMAWTTPVAMGVLLCDGHLCCERGAWKGLPYLLATRPLRQAARKWHNDHCKRIKRDGVAYFDGTVGIWQPPAQVMPVEMQTAPLAQGRKQAESAGVSRSSPTPLRRTPRRRQASARSGPGRS